MPPDRAIVVGGGVLGLATAHALREDGFQVTVREQHTVGTPLGSSPGRSRIYRTSYRSSDYVQLARRAIERWQRLDAALLLPNGLLEYGEGVADNAACLEACGEPHEWLEPVEAARRFPQARFDQPVLWTADAGVIRADLALRRLRERIDVQEGSPVEDPHALQADIVCVCAGAWLGRLFDLPLHPRIEQVAYLAGANHEAPSVINHGTGDGRQWYGLVTPGVGYKLAQDAARPDMFDPDQPDRPVRDDLLDTLAAHVTDRFPGLDPHPVASEACLYTMTPDSDFILDWIDGVVVLGGDSGHAFKFAPLLGRLAADLAQGRALPEQCARFRADRFTTIAGAASTTASPPPARAS